LENENTIFLSTPLKLCLIVIVVAAAALWLEGRAWWCPGYDYSPWAWDIWSRHNSQHLIDPYSFTHVLHGMLEFWLIALIFRKVPLAWRLLIALIIEGSWEVIENSTYMINRYRQETISLDYFGDSIINSISDIACCGIGFLIASKLRFWKSLALFVATEIILIASIHDSLLINIIMLIYPFESIKHWQIGH
jgi:Protein of unknown function (DUF2585)